MRRILRRAFAGLLSLALVASGTTLGLVSVSPAHAKSAQHTHHADGHHAHSDAKHAHHADQHDASRASDDEAQPASHHPSNNCCSACTVASPLPCAPDPSVQLIVSPAVYSTLTRFNLAVALAVDPGIPKRMG